MLIRTFVISAALLAVTLAGCTKRPPSNSTVHNAAVPATWSDRYEGKL